MKLTELITTMATNPIITMIKSNYPLFYNYFTTKFNEYELKYSTPVFLEQLFAIIQSHNIELQALELSQGLTNDNIGTIKTNKRDKTSKANDKNKDSYKGFNVSGDFAITDIERDYNDNENSEIIERNYYEYLISVNSQQFKQNWASVEKELTSLFIMYVI